MIVFMTLILTSSVIYLFEKDAQPEAFGSIHEAMWWGLATLTTVGYGDIVATTITGKFLTSFFVLSGYAIIAVPTGIVTSELIKSHFGDHTSEACQGCGIHGHLPDAKYCRCCGDKLH